MSPTIIKIPDGEYLHKTVFDALGDVKLKIRYCNIIGTVRIPVKITVCHGVTFTEKDIDLNKDGYLFYDGGKIKAENGFVVFENTSGDTISIAATDKDTIALAMQHEFYGGFGGLTLKEYLNKLGLI